MIFLFVYSVGMKPESPVDLFQKLMVDGKQRVLYFGKNPKNFNNSAISHSFDTHSNLALNIIFGIMETWLRLCAHITYTIIEFLYTGPLPLTIWLVTELFITNTEQMHLMTWSDLKINLVKKYELLKSVSNSMNSVWALGLFIWILDVSLRILFLRNSMIASTDPLNLVNAVISVIIPATAMFLSGEVYRKVCKYK